MLYSAESAFSLKRKNVHNIMATSAFVGKKRNLSPQMAPSQIVLFNIRDS